jgi:MGT family glycosyltransferase
MSTVLVYTSPSRGHLYPIMGIALSLAHRGHTVSLRTLSSETTTVARAGLPVQPIARAIEERVIDDWTARSQLESAKRALQTFVDRAALEVDDIQQAMDDVRPDLVLVDTNAWGAQAACEPRTVPWATWHPYPMPYPSRDAPPFGPGLVPARVRIGRLRDRMLAPIVFGLMQRFLPQLNDVRVRAGASPLAHIVELYLQPPLLLHMTAEPFEYPRRDWPKNFALVGPGLWSPSTVSTPAWLTSSAKPIVLVTCSSEFQDDGALIDVAIAALGADESVQLVCTTAGTDPARFRAPTGVIVERFVPHALVLPQACTVVCHGGMGITQRALAAGVPPCVVPWGRDQLEVARRVVQSRAGALVPRAKLTPVRLRAAVEEARRNADGAAGVAAVFARAGGTDRAVALLEGLLVSGRPDPGRMSEAAEAS